MKYLKYFETEAEYNAYKDSEDFVLPNVSYVEDIGQICYHIIKTETGDYKIFLLEKKDISGLTYNMVDLGLPSGLLWADKNVGATSPEDYGTAFAWGETEGYNLSASYVTASELCAYMQPTLGDEMTLTPDNIDEVLSELGITNKDLTISGVGFLTDKCFSSDWSDYFDTTDGGSTFNKYSLDKLTLLQPEDDAATVNMGSNWRMPTEAEMDELKQYCDYEEDAYDIKPYKFTSKINGNSIIIPAPLTVAYGTPYIDTSYDRVWSSELYSNDCGKTCLIYNSSAGGWEERRCFGLPVRGVKA